MQQAHVVAVRDEVTSEQHPDPAGDVLEVEHVLRRACGSKLNLPAGWSPKGPLPLVRLIATH